MIAQEYIFGEIPEKDIVTDKNETAARLRVARDYSDKLIKDCESLVRSNIACRYSAVKVPVIYPRQDFVDLGFGPFKSVSLCRNLKSSDEAFIFAVTLGHGVDRLLRRLSVTSVSEHFAADAIASALAESACDAADRIIRGNTECYPRFSPGYGDMPLSVQPQILEMVNALRLLNITIGDNLLMTPVKSITAVMGIKNEKTD